MTRNGDRSQRWARSARIAALACLAGTALLTAACGGGSPGAAGSSGADQGRLQQALAFAHCMRSHGLPNFPDPDSSGAFPMDRTQTSNVGARLAAKAACNHLYPNMGKGQLHPESTQHQRRALAFAACMRRHRIANFPDGWSGNVGQLISAGIDPNSPQLNAALTKCGF